METQTASRSKQQSSAGFFKKLCRLTICGGVIFWAATLAISLLPIAAKYRASFTNRSWNIQTVWVDSIFAGTIIACCVSCSLLRFMDKHPAQNPIQKSVTLGFIALVIATILIDVPRSFLLPGSRDALYYFITGILLNAPRFLILGTAIGCLYKRWI